MTKRVTRWKSLIKQPYITQVGEIESLSKLMDQRFTKHAGYGKLYSGLFGNQIRDGLVDVVESVTSLP
jgi:hypothetical protein